MRRALGRAVAIAVSGGPPASGEAIRRAAELLVEARRTGRRLAALPPGCRPRSAAEAYAVQDAVVRALGGHRGWKVGARSPQAEPTCAPLPAALILPSPQRFPDGAFAHKGIEAEIAFTLARDLPPRARPYVEGEMQAAMASIHPAIEVVDSRFLDIASTDALSLLADFNSNGVLVIGAGIALPDAFASESHTVQLDIDGRRIVEARGSNPAGSLERLLAWLANHSAVRCGGLRRGDVVTTGSWTGMRFVAAGTHVEATFSGLGGARVDL